MKAIVTTGPTVEPIDPVRFLSNHSSGKQGHAIADFLSQVNIDVSIVSGPTLSPPPVGVKVYEVQTAQEMLETCEKLLPVDVVVCAAAVCDWRPEIYSPQKTKKQSDVDRLILSFVKTPDILYSIATHSTKRPKLVVGFAAETDDVIANASIKRIAKQCDWILANDVSNGAVFGSDDTHIHFISQGRTEDWGKSTKESAAKRLANEVIIALQS